MAKKSAKTIRAQDEAAQYAMSQDKPTRAYYEALLENPNVQRGLGVIRATEGTAKGKNPYAVAFGGGTIKDLSRHPGKAHSFTWNGKPAKTTAAGAYQFLGRTWGATAGKLGLKDFGPKNQDIAALALIDQRGGLNHLLSGNLKGFVNKVGKEWASLPSAKYGQPTKSWNYVQNVWNNGGKAVTNAAKSAWNTAVSLPDKISVPEYRPDFAAAANPSLADRPSMATKAQGMPPPRAEFPGVPSSSFSLPSSAPTPFSRPERTFGAPAGAVQRGGPLAPLSSIRDMVANQARFAPELANPSRFAPSMPNPSRFTGTMPAMLDRTNKALTAGLTQATRVASPAMTTIAAAPNLLGAPVGPAGPYSRSIAPQQLPSQMAAPSIGRPGPSFAALPSQMAAPSFRMETAMPGGRPSFPSLPSQMAAPGMRGQMPSQMAMGRPAMGYAPQNLAAAAAAAQKERSMRGLLESMLGGGGRSSGPSGGGKGGGGRSGGSPGSRGGPNNSDRPSLW